MGRPPANFQANLPTPAETARFEKLSQTCYRQVFKYAYSLTNSRTDAEDLTQEALLRAYRGFRSYDPARPFLHWISRIVHNVFVDSLRAKKQPFALSLDALKENETGDSALALQLPDSQYDPQRILLSQTMDERLEQALNSLQPEFRNSILLCDIHGLSYEEIADVMHCSLGTVRSRIHRARKLLRTALLEAVVENKILPGSGATRTFAPLAGY